MLFNMNGGRGPGGGEEGGGKGGRARLGAEWARLGHAGGEGHTSTVALM